jgi:hypothetical protein
MQYTHTAGLTEFKACGESVRLRLESTTYMQLSVQQKDLTVKLGLPFRKVGEDVKFMPQEQQFSL